MLKLTLRYSGYYTHLSFILFIISFMFPFTSYIKSFILINSVIVGIAGNLIYIKDYKAFVLWYKHNFPDMNNDDINQELSLGNLFTHTFPMIISCILLIYCTSFINNFKDAIVFFLLELCVFLIWSLFPYQNQILEEKINSSYPSTQFAITITYFICFFLLCLMAYLR